MESLHPYGKEDIRVVSDLSRFEYEKHAPRNRSRNVTPTDQQSEVMPPRRRNMVEIAELAQGSSAYDMRDDLYNFYADPQTQHPEQFAPYPPLVRDAPPVPPPKDYKSYYGHRNILQAQHNNQDLPPLQDSRDYAAQQQGLMPPEPAHEPSAGIPENILLERVLNKPLFRLGGGNVPNADPKHQPPRYTVTVNSVVDFFQIIFGIIIITLASVLGSEDFRIAIGIYRYFIAVGVITLVVSLLFITKTINFERRNGIFYCLISCILTGVSLVLSITSIATNLNCATGSICAMRKTLSTFAILSFFLWVCTMVMYLTTLYISRMNLLDEINMEYSSHGVPGEFSGPPRYSSNRDPIMSPPVDELPPQAQPSQEYVHPELPQYFLHATGELRPLLHHEDIRGTKKMVVYTLV